MFFVIFPFYMVINYYLKGIGAKGYDLTTPIDRLISFQPLWQYVYVSIYTFVLFPAVYIKDNQVFRRAFCAFLFVQLFAFSVFLLFPTQIQRGEKMVAGKEGFVAWGIRLNYQLDPPYNCFPSLHVGNSFVAALSLHYVDPFAGWLALFWAVLISYSTLAVKHHFFLDVVAGALLAFFAHWLFLFPLRQGKSQPELRRSRLVLCIPLFAYFFTLLVAWVLYLVGYPA